MHVCAFVWSLLFYDKVILFKKISTFQHFHILNSKKKSFSEDFKGMVLDFEICKVVLAILRDCDTFQALQAFDLCCR